MHSPHHPKHQEAVGERKIAQCLILWLPVNFICRMKTGFASKGAHLNLKRAERAWAAINKLPGIFHMPLSVINNIKEKMFLEFWEYVCEF
jgi:hypothetical protein